MNDARAEQVPAGDDYGQEAPGRCVGSCAEVAEYARQVAADPFGAAAELVHGALVTGQQVFGFVSELGRGPVTDMLS